MKVFVIYDPLYEQVVCVHTTEDGRCDKCNNDEMNNRTSYQLTGDWFDVNEN
jgi:hypothetical protein